MNEGMDDVRQVMCHRRYPIYPIDGMDRNSVGFLDVGVGLQAMLTRNPILYLPERDVDVPDLLDGPGDGATPGGSGFKRGSSFPQSTLPFSSTTFISTSVIDSDDRYITENVPSWTLSMLEISHCLPRRFLVSWSTLPRWQDCRWLAGSIPRTRRG